ncbi:DUF2089 family protein [Salimicrobium sp. PL1-032A]|uniref:DUF2089 family protein n=1 Tax=Salimicrobium sp. PL1-032A TaxID=3095364 RepID=UPI003261809B
MRMKELPAWILALDEEDLQFIKNFILHSGSLKKIAAVYGVSYPTVRVKLDKLIQKVEMNDSLENEEFISFIKQLSIDDRIDIEEAKLIIDKYKQEKGKEG